MINHVDMEQTEGSLPKGWTRGERVYLAFLEHIWDSAVQSRIDIGERTHKVILCGKLGVTCRCFR